MPERIPYPLPTPGPLRELAAYLHEGILSARDAANLLDQGFSWNLLAPYVQDRDWWLAQHPAAGRPLAQPWQMKAWGATLELKAPDETIWIDPGPRAPMPSRPPDLIVVTHAHHDHTASLGELSDAFPETPVAMSHQTATLLALRAPLDRLLQACLAQRVVCLALGKERTLGGVRVTLRSAGHLLGATMAELRLAEDAILITGDLALRDVGGVPRAEWPQAEYNLVVMESATAGCGSLPVADAETNRRPFLNQVAELVEQGRTRLLVSVQAMGQAQELYAALVMAQRAGAFPKSTIRLTGMAARVSDEYYRALSYLPGPWSCPFEMASDSVPDGSVVIMGATNSEVTKESDHLRDQGQSSGSGVIHNAIVYTHGGWSEHMALATGIACHEVALYHGYSASLEMTLVEMGRKVTALSSEAIEW